MTAEQIQISATDNVGIKEVFQGLLEGDLELIDLPESFNSDGKTFPITTETIISGLSLHLRKHNKELRRQIAVADVDGALYKGIEVTSTQGENDKIHLKLSTGKDIRIYPSTFTPETFKELLSSATPRSVEDFDYYTRDILNDFTKRGLIVSNDFDYDGWSGWQYSKVTEKRSSHASELVAKLGTLAKLQEKALGDDYSKNLAVRNIATQLFKEMNADPNPEGYAVKFASTWLELRFQQEIALRTRTDRVFQQSDFAKNTYQPGSEKSVPKSMTILKNTEYI